MGPNGCVNSFCPKDANNMKISTPNIKVKAPDKNNDKNVTTLSDKGTKLIINIINAIKIIATSTISCK